MEEEAEEEGKIEGEEIDDGYRAFDALIAGKEQHEDKKDEDESSSDGSQVVSDEEPEEADSVLVDCLDGFAEGKETNGIEIGEWGLLDVGEDAFSVDVAGQSFGVEEIHGSEREEDAVEDGFLEQYPEQKDQYRHEEGGNEDADVLNSQRQEQGEGDTGKQGAEEVGEFLSFLHEEGKRQRDGTSEQGIGKDEECFDGSLVTSHAEEEEEDGYGKEEK